MIYIERNNRRFGPYDDATLVSYVNSGQILLCDLAFDDVAGKNITIRKYLKTKHLKARVQHGGSIFNQFKKNIEKHNQNKDLAEII